MRFLALACFTCSLALSSGAHSQHAADSDWGRGIHVLGSALFDIGQSRFRYGFYTGQITDCSDDEFYCLSNDIADLVLPKACQNFTIGTEWSAGNNLSTSVIGQFEQPQGHLTIQNKKLAVLVTRSTPRFAYIYGGSTGILGMVFIANPDVTFDSLAKSGALDNALQLLMRGRRSGDLVYLPLITSDQFAPCDPTNVWEPNGSH